MSSCRAGTVALLVTLVAACGSDDAETGASALVRLGVQESDAQLYALDSLATGQPYGIVSSAGRAFKALPDDEREEVIEGMAAWARSYLDSDLFRTAYAERRAWSRPAPREYDESVDEAMERWAEEGLEQIEETRTAVVPILPEADRAEMLAGLDSMEAQYNDPEFIALQRQTLEMQREDEQRSYEESLARWEADLPEDSNELIKRRLQAFLTVCSDVDFDAELEERYGLQRFVETSYERKPWEWKLCFRAGEDSVAVAREVAEEWLDELD